MDKSVLEEINLEGWNLMEDTPNQKVYQKEDIQKRIPFFENYSVEAHYKKEGRLQTKRNRTRRKNLVE